MSARAMCDSADTSKISALLKLYTFFLLTLQTLFRLSDTAINVLLAVCQLFLNLSFQSFQQQNTLLALTEQVVEPSFRTFVALLVTAYTSGRNALFTSLTINLCQNTVHFKGFPIIHNISIAMGVVKD